ncbi:hypothetical protein [Streptomyces reniochalinae]|uniref:hypothetical protein n=1 Tax=Streptomyces reniochalinae TaxID=2250578 RepID=UPI001FE7F611|nr:hypothetical protein [Streptomyces reniochalinae]
MSERPATLDVEQAEAALVRHYPRLVRLAYGMLDGAPRRAVTAHEVARSALPRRCTSTARLPLTGARGEDPVYVWLRLRVVRAALERPWWPRRPPPTEAPARAAHALRHLEGLTDPAIRQLLGAAHVRDPDAALAHAETVAHAEAPACAASVARAGTGDDGEQVTRTEAEARAGSVARTGAAAEAGADAGTDAAAEAGTDAVGDRAAAEARFVPAPGPAPEEGPAPAAGRTSGAEHAPEAGPAAGPGPASGAGQTVGTGPAAGPGPAAGAGHAPGSGQVPGPGAACALCAVGGADPLVVVRRRRRARVVAAAVGAALACCGLLGVPGDTWGPDAATRAPLVRGTDAQRALDPGALVRVGADTWRLASRVDLGTWPARGALTGDASLLRRALVAWARPRTDVRVSATPGTATGPPPGPPHLLYAGRLDGTAVVVLYDGLRVARYTEPWDARDGSRAARDGVSVELARTAGAGAGAAASGALAVSRTEGEVRYLTAPWVAGVARVDLLDPGDREGRVLSRDEAGVTARVPLPVTQPGHCESWPGLALAGSRGVAEDVQLYTDLGEPLPARLTDGKRRDPATGAAARRRLAHTVCRLPAVLDRGVETVNTWEFARQRLPDGAGEAAWVCTRAETWRGTGARVLTGFQPPAAAPGHRGAVTWRARDTRACGPRSHEVLAGALWRSERGDWYVLAAADAGVTRLRARGRGLAEGPVAAVGHTLAARVGGRDASVRLAGERADGSTEHARTRLG